MKRINLFPALAVTLGILTPQAMAQRQSAVGPGIIPLDATGILGGVDMSASATTGTLSVGVVGGPKQDIFTLNSALVAGMQAVSTAASSQGNITFNSSSDVFGAIGVTQPGGPFLRNIRAGSMGTTVNFFGPVYATTLDVTGTGNVNFMSGNTNIVAPNFAGDGVITLAPNTTVIGALTTAAGAGTGTLVLGGGSFLDGAVGGAAGLRSINVSGGSNAAGVVGTITGAANAFNFDLGTNTLNVGGALTIANGGAGGTVNTTIGSTSVYGNIRPVGATNLGPTLNVNVLVPSTTFIPVGSQFNIIQTQSGTVQSGTNGSVLNVTIRNPTNPLYSFSAVPLAGTIAGQVTIQTTAIPLLVPILPTVPVTTPIVPVTPGVTPVVPATVAVATLSPTVPVAAAIVPVLLAPTVVLRPDIISVLAPINALSDPVAVVNAVTQLAPSASNLAIPLITYQGTRQFQSLWLPRMDDVQCGTTGQVRRQDGTTETCRTGERRNGIWMNGFGYSASQGARGSFVGYNAGAFGVMMGYDAQITPETRVGIALGYGRTNVNGRVFDSRTNFDSYVATAYVGHERGRWYVNGAASVGLHDYQDRRTINFPGVSRQANSRAMGQDYTLFGTTGYNIDTNGFRITPLASLQYSRVNVGNFNETGAGDLNLNVRARSNDFLESGLGVKVSRPFTSGTVTIRPQVHARWLHQFGDSTMTQTASFGLEGSSSFQTPGFSSSRNTLNVGGSVTLLSCNCTTRSWSVEGTYDYFHRMDGYAAHRGMVRLTSRF